jgi:heat shock protein HslJ
MDGLWQSRGGRLVVAALLVGLAAVALAVLIPNRETTDLGGTAWTLLAYGPAGAPSAAAAPASITFEANGRFSGSTGCNGFFGNYRAADGQLSFVDDELAFTAMGCDPAMAEGQQEEFFRSHLSEIRYTQTADRLTLHFADGQIAEYVPAP